MKHIKMKLKWLPVLIAGVLFVAPLPSRAQSTTNNDADIQTLKQEIHELEQKVDNLQHQQQETHEVVTAVTNKAAKPTAQLTVGANGVNFISANSNFVAGLHAWVQVDSRTFFEKGAPPGIDGFLLRRARLIFAGTVYHDFDYNLTPEFAGNTPQILDAFINYRYNQQLQLEVGKYKPPIGLEALQPDIYTFLNERSLATDLVPYRSIGAEIHNILFGDAVGYAIGVFNGLPDYNTSTINTNIDNGVAVAGRVFTQPFEQTSISPLQGLGVGVAGSYEHDQATAAGLTPGYTTDGQEKFFTYGSTTVANGEHWRVSPQGYYYWGPLGLMSEYVVSDQRVTKTAPVVSANMHNTAWEVSGGWVLTGENDSYNGVTPLHPFNPRHGDWGAWQIVARYADLDVDNAAFTDGFASAATSASRAQAWSAGLNWYLNTNLRANLSFSRTVFTGGATGPVTKQPEEVLFTRMQLAF